MRINSDRSPAKGYGVLVAEVDSIPRSLRTFGRRLVEQFHDRPLAILGVRNGLQGRREVVVVRPRLIHAGGGSVSIAKLTIDVERPTAHDAEVVSGLAWDAWDADAAHDQIDKALDAERVTRKFFEGLSGHYQRLLAAVTAAGKADAGVLAGLERAGGADRVALRITTQVLFCYFVQRKGLLEGDRGWLTRRFQANLSRGSYYQRVLEPLFYEALAKPVAARPEEWRRGLSICLKSVSVSTFSDKEEANMSVQLPAKIVKADGDDLAAPLQQLLRDLGLLETEDDIKKGVSLRGTPDSLQLIRAGATSVAKWWTGIAGLAGFGTAVAALLSAWNAQSSTSKVVLIGGASAILAATVISIAWIIQSDLRSRAQTSVELYRSRARLSTTFLATATALAAGETRPAAATGGAATADLTIASLLAAFTVTVPKQLDSPGLYGIRHERGSTTWEIRRSDGDWVNAIQGTEFRFEPPLPKT